jgi:diguanylate cyclase (GGDEF)-like protein
MAVGRAREVRLNAFDTYRQISERELERRFARFLEELTENLLRSSPSPHQGQISRTQVTDAIGILQIHQRGMLASFLGHYHSFHDNLTPPAAELHHWWDVMDESGTMDLVDLHTFENYLAVDRLAHVGEDLHRIGMEALQIRVAELVQTDPLKLRLPEHVAQLARSLQLVLEEYRVPQQLTQRIYDLFARHFVRNLDSLYRHLNDILEQAGIRPDLEGEILANGSLLRKADERPDRTHRRRQDAGMGGSSANGGDGAESRPQQLYSSVINALNFKREVEQQPQPAGAVLDTQKLINALAQLQQIGKSPQAAAGETAVADFLLGQTPGLKGDAALSAENRNQLEMIDSLFETIRSQLDVSSELQPVLSDLQLPLARLALTEPQFFLQPDHPARTLVDKLAALGSSANFPNRLLESRVAEIVAAIVRDYDGDSAVFAAALEHVERLSRQQSQAHARNIERVVKTQEGKEKLRGARDAVESVVRECLPPGQIPRILQELIDHGWRDLMVLTHVKQGVGSDDWEEQRRTLQLLTTWLLEQQRGEVSEDQSVERSLEAEPFIDLMEQQISGALPGNVSIQAVFDELRGVLAGDIAVDMLQRDSEADGDTDGETQPTREERLAKTRRLRRWVQRVDTLGKGMWLNYRDKAGVKHRIQLAWISDDRERFLFVNDRGQKVAEFNQVQLARQLSRGAQPPAPADRLSVVDQSMYNTLEDVQRTLSFARNHDPLTRLINRDIFIDQVGRALRHAHTHHSQHAILLLNIDRFGLVNDIYDRISGDQVLLEFSRLLAQLHGRKTSSARLEEDTFAILLVDGNIEKAQALAEQVRSDIADGTVDIDGEKVSFTVSVGIAPIQDYSPDVDSVMANAQAAVTQAKQLGRNRVHLYEASEETVRTLRSEQRRSRKALEDELSSERFMLRAQPIVKTAMTGESSTTRHYELLLAMRDKSGKLSSPQSFITSAERHGIMTLVDRWVVREAFMWINSLMDAQKVVPSVAINLSGASVTDDAFLDFLFEQISEFGVGTNRLCFEITETGTISNLVKAADFVRAFRNIGCKFSIDDFGTGLASHNYLRELPVDYVKIDGSFITGIDQDSNDYAMARSINDLAHFLGQETIAESVENEAIIRKLQEIGVDYLQGWGIGRPKPLAEVTLDLSSIEK